MSRPDPPSTSRPARATISREANGQPRTLRLASTRARHAGYRRLALAIVGLDVATLAAQLRNARRGMPLVRAA